MYDPGGTVPTGKAGEDEREDGVRAKVYLPRSLLPRDGYSTLKNLGMETNTTEEMD